MFKILLFIFFITFTLSSQAAPGDTTSVFVHNATNMTSYGNYDQEGVFPDGSKSYRKVLMTYTLGCASSGCSGWDYTTQIFFRRPTSNYDSTIIHLDTISTTPLTVDTTWNVYEVLEDMELGRVITPYGTYMANNSSGYSNAWKHRYYFDVTDYVHLLQDTCMIRAFYGGYSSGFSVTLRFDFIEGTPAREVLSIQNIYKGSSDYSNSNNFEATYFNQKTVYAPSNAVSARIFSTITGHGFDNNVSCAEFCSRQYTVNTNNNYLGTATIWKDDCGKNPIYPQGGTWVYDRAGWCPGSKANVHEFEWSSFDAGLNNTIDFDLQNYTWSGTQAPSYIVNAQAVFYGAINNNNDAALIDIIAPSKHEEHRRQNPFCGNPKIRVKNLGAQPLTSMLIEYNLNGAETCSYTWTGNILFLEEQEIELPTLQWQGVNTSDPRFRATIVRVNGLADEYVHDNSMQTSYDVPEILSWNFLNLGILSNNYGNETSYSIKDKDGNSVFERLQGTLSSNTLYKDSIFLADGCYTLTVKDHGGDGLGWWANTAQGTGAVRFYSPIFSFSIIRTLPVDFGSELNYTFIWHHIDSIQSACTLLTGHTEIPTKIGLTHNIYPNPSTGLCTVEIGSSLLQDYTCSIYNVLGGLVYQKNISNSTHEILQIDLQKQAAGVYLLEVKGSEGEKRVEKFIITK